ncbi:NTP transferase domain-containing protein [Archaeoglobus veneficus]|uniref:MobA-like NTP transferase domain-containing protein n=1 Tax=Archaeoglobus veneficus (strain DSM 11195 / SNP6) TaxID=693661 RepID=F2KQS1_ARCVS|nr:NTP transferase domain-containing protein [Archaeoglobus veneficus]AEA46633.1 hypothetical protein Arcve_0612 [Archaeoglobus veneficus SNP6]
MLALVMCGGKGSRLGMGEKPLVKVCGKRLIEHVLDALWPCEEVLGAVTDYTPETAAFLRREGIEVVKTSGAGFVEDMCEAITSLSIAEPVLVVAADLFFLKDVIPEVINAYYTVSTRALATAYPDGEYAGINVVDGMFLGDEQEEVIYRVGRNEVLNINTPDDLIRAEELWKAWKTSFTMRKEGEWWKD